MVSELQAGDTFAAAAGAHPEAFPRYYVAVLESAELTGTLDTVLLELATYLETDIEARSAITSALIYPAVVAVMAVVTVIVLATFVLPKFRTFFASLNAKLPLPTRMLLSISGFISTWWWAIAGDHPGGDRLVRGIAALTAGPGVARLGVSEASRRGKPSPSGHRRACVPCSGVAGHRRRRPSSRHGRHRRGVQQRRLHRGLNHIREQMMEGRGWPPARRNRTLPGGGPPDVPGRRGDRNAGQAALDGGRLLPPGARDSRSSTSPACSSRPSSSSWA